MQPKSAQARVALIEAGSPGLNLYSHVAMGRGITMLASILDAQGVLTRAFIEDISGKDSVDWEYVATADVVGFSVITCTLTRTSELIARTRRANPRALIVLGGPEPTFAPERSFDAGADYVLKGEAEFTLPRFVREAIAASRSAAVPTPEMKQIPGLVWQGEAALEFGPAARQLTKGEVDSLPSIDTSLIHGYENATTGLVWRARGCPERCSFCEVHQIWPRYVVRNEDQSVLELMRCQSQGRGGVFLIDDKLSSKQAGLQALPLQCHSGWISPPHRDSVARRCRVRQSRRRRPRASGPTPRRRTVHRLVRRHRIRRRRRPRSDRQERYCGPRGSRAKGDAELRPARARDDDRLR